MNLGEWLGRPVPKGVLVDTNLLVLFIVGCVNRDRISRFRRTAKYTETDFDLLVQVMESFQRRYTLAHVLAEVSNLTQLSGSEGDRARNILRETISIFDERPIPSAVAATYPHYQRLGLTDAAIAIVARDVDCAVLTDDVSLWLTISAEGRAALNFAHIQEKAWGV